MGEGKEEKRMGEGLREEGGKERIRVKEKWRKGEETGKGIEGRKEEEMGEREGKRRGSGGVGEGTGGGGRTEVHRRAKEEEIRREISGKRDGGEREWKWKEFNVNVICV